MGKTSKGIFWRAAFVALLFFMFSNPGAAEPRYGGVLTWRLATTTPPTLDPAYATVTDAVRGVSLYGETLVGIRADGKGFAPLLAESWEVNRSSTVWTFRLKQGVKFHKTGYQGAATANGGREMTAADVKYSFERLIVKRSPRVYFLNQIKGYQDFWDGKATDWAGIQVVDDRTVRFTLTTPYAPFLATLSYALFCVLPREDAERLGDTFEHRPVATGPFIVDSWDLSRVAFRKNPEYWQRDDRGQPLPYLDGVDLIPVSDDRSAVAAFQAASLDVLPNVPHQYRADFLKEKSYQSRPNVLVFYYGMAVDQKPFDDLKVRQAFNYAVDREGINARLMGNGYQVAQGVLPPGMPAYNPDLKAYGYDPQKAKTLLKEAGYGDGLSVTFHCTENATQRMIAEAVREQLADVGVRVELQIADVKSHYAAVRRGEMSFFYAAWAGDYPDPDNFLYNLFCSDNFGAKGNYTHYKNDEVDAWLKAARRTIDPKVRFELYRKAEQQIVNDAPWIFLFHDTTNLATGPNVRDLHLTFMGYHQTPLTEVWKEE